MSIESQRAPLIQARYFGPAFDALHPRQICIHSLECDVKKISRDLALGYFRQVGNKTSAHSAHDPVEGVRMVPEGQRAWHCGGGNAYSKGREHAGRAGFAKEQWLTPDALRMLRNSAHETALDCIEYDIPARWLSVAQVAADEKGLCTHNDMRLARGGTTHWDPGPNFPYGLYLQYVIEEIAKIQGGSVPAPPPVAPAPPAAGGEITGGSYKVQSGDTLSSIARRAGVAVSDLQAWNGIKNPNVIEVGQTLRLTKPVATKPTPPPAKPAAPKPVSPSTGRKPPYPLPSPYYFGVRSGGRYSLSGIPDSSAKWRPSIKLIQTYLNLSGERLAVDGKYGDGTAAAVKRWQAKFMPEGEDDGKVGSRTWNWMGLRVK